MANKKPENKKRTINPKTYKELMERLAKMPPPEIEETLQCFHTSLKKIVKDDIVYQCQNPDCNAIVEVYGCKVSHPVHFAMLSAQIQLQIAQGNPQAREFIRGFVKEAYKDTE
jgi:hypothetical protein